VTTPLQVLVVEDNAGDARLLHEMFRKERPGSFVITHLERVADALVRLEQGGVDIVLLDMGLPDGRGADTVRRVQAAAPHVPIIVLTGLDDEALAAEAMKEGAQDYLIKGQIESRALPRALRHAIERHRMHEEAEVTRRTQLQFKDMFLSHVSHELRSPLNAIYQFTSILSDNLAGDLTDTQHRHLDTVLRNVAQLQAMIDDLLEVTRVQGGQVAIDLQCTSISEMAAFAVSTLEGPALAKGVRISLELGNRLPLVCADPLRVRQIFIILLDNAIKFTPAGGTVRIQARVAPEDPTRLVLSVKDNGCGIAPGLTERIFDRLFQASDPALAGRRGLGLGLFICKELVTRQGGRIWAESAPGEGAVLSFTLPVFSMHDTLAATLRDADNSDGSMALIVTELGSETGWLSAEARVEHSCGIRKLLRSSLHSQHDVLLPKMGETGAAELFFVVAATNRAGGQTLARRIQRNFDESANTLKAGLVLKTSFETFKVSERQGALSAGTKSDELAATVHSMVSAELSSRAVAHV
jgi:signal transduction histidine kinase